MRFSTVVAIAARSAWHRRFSLSLVVASIALTAFLLLSVERLRQDVRDNFSNAVSGTDLIVGARTGSVQLLLYSVFRIGASTNTLKYGNLEWLEQDRAVEWVIPLALGDSHKGFPVVGTDERYFTHFRYGESRALVLSDGAVFQKPFDAVLGADVARQLAYRPGDRIVLRHGAGDLDLNDHADKPFTVVGILARTGTPVDRSVHISLQGMEALHLDWMAGMPLPGFAISAEQALQRELKPRTLTAVLVGLKNRTSVFGLQRRVSEFQTEPLMAILPGVALDELWSALGHIETALQIMGVLVGVVSLAGLVSVVMTALEQRRRELAVLRSVGTGPGSIFLLLGLEGLLVSAAGVFSGLLVWWLTIVVLSPWIRFEYGIAISTSMPGPTEWMWLAGMVLTGWLASVLPGWRAYRLSLADGLTPRF